MSNEQFIADGMTLLKGKVNLERLQKKLSKISADSTEDYAVDEMERVLISHGYEVLWGSGYRIV